MPCIKTNQLIGRNSPPRVLRLVSPVESPAEPKENKKQEQAGATRPNLKLARGSTRRRVLFFLLRRLPILHRQSNTCNCCHRPHGRRSLFVPLNAKWSCLRFTFFLVTQPPLPKLLTHSHSFDRVSPLIQSWQTVALLRMNASLRAVLLPRPLPAAACTRLSTLRASSLARPFLLGSPHVLKINC